MIKCINIDALEKAEISSHAIVIGGSITGSVIARVLSDHYKKVTIIEKDKVTPNTNLRKGVPQEVHPHVFLLKGQELLEELFPNYFNELESEGAEIVDLILDNKVFYNNFWKERFSSCLRGYSCSRALIDLIIRKRIQKIKNIEFIDERTVKGLLIDNTNSVIVGVITEDNLNQSQNYLSDLVVDASGRGSKSSIWLKSLGFSPPTKSEVRTDHVYATRLYGRPAEYKEQWKSLVILPYHSKTNTIKFGGIFPMEGNKWIVGIGSCISDSPKKTEEDFLAFAQSLAVPDLFEAIKNAKPFSPIKIYNVKNSLRRYYENMHKWPKNFLVCGDGLCSFNPRLGQGLTIGIQEAHLIGENLKKKISLNPYHNLFQSIQKQIGKKIIEPAWKLCLLFDEMQFKGIGKKKTIFLKLQHWYITKLFEMSKTDQNVNLAILKVSNMLASPKTLLQFRLLLKVIFISLKNFVSKKDLT